MTIMKSNTLKIVYEGNTNTGSFWTISLQEITGNVSSLNTTGFRFGSESVSSRFDLLILVKEEEKKGKEWSSCHHVFCCYFDNM